MHYRFVYLKGFVGAEELFLEICTGWKFGSSEEGH
jgi:hypothetical protein